MLVNVAQLLKSPIGTERKYEVNEAFEINGTETLVKGDVSFTRTDRSILVKGIFNAEIELACSRCLEKIINPLEVKFEEEYFPTIDIISGALLARPEEPGAFSINEHHVIDLSEAVRQYAIAAIPMKPLCRTDCAGICPTCGHDLNEGSCTCLSQEIDLRWAKLKKLMSKETRKE